MAKTEKKQVSLEAGLWNACNKLRGSVTATDYVNVVLGLLFLRFAYDKFNAQREKILSDEDTADFIDNPRFYSKDNVFYLEETDQWSYIKDNSKSNKIFTYIDDAFKNIEKNNATLKGALPIGFYITLHIEPSKFSSLIDEIDRIQYSQEESDDVIGRVYEYFLKKFCIAAKSEKGEFYTPGNIVELMTLLIQPYAGSVYDPCCGSGGMFVQSAEFIKHHKGNKKDITIYGQESNDKTYKLARMNLAIRGLNCDLGDMDASTFTSDKHPNLRADFILANPPFNLKGWRTENELRNDRRWDGYEVPPTSNANYAWILHILARLSYNGTAAFLLANGALNAGAEEYRIRKQLIENHKIEAIIVLPREMFYATPISVTLWICGNHKKEKKIKRNDQEQIVRNRENEILFIDARTLGDGGANEEGYVLLTDEDKDQISQTFFNWQSKDWLSNYKDIPEFCYSATLDEVRKNDYSLTPSKYIKFIECDLGIDYTKEMSLIQNEMEILLRKNADIQEQLKVAFGGINNLLDDLMYSYESHTLGEYIEQTDNRNTELEYGQDSVMGMTITKEIMPTKANVAATDLAKFKIVYPKEFVYNPRTHGRKIGLGFNQDDKPFIITWNNIAFKIKESMKSRVLPEYLYMYFCRDEWDREACFRSWGSSTEVFAWDALCEMKISLPPIELQESVIAIYRANNEGRKVFEDMQQIQKRICPLLIRGAIEEGTY